jgi:hypothetical protein
MALRRLTAKFEKIIVDLQAASPSSWKMALHEYLFCEIAAGIPLRDNISHRVLI